MGSQKLQKILGVIGGQMDSRQVPFALIGAHALGMYGIPRYTADLDLLADYRDVKEITAILEKLDFHCRQKTEAFAQFDSEFGIYGRVDCMFVQTQDGRDMLGRRVYVTDLVMGTVPVVQPTDYIVLKLMAMANQPERRAGDESDIRSVLDCYRLNQIPAWCGSLDRERIEKFAAKFGQEKVAKKLFQESSGTPEPGEGFVI
jgi:hypothetical protein